MNKKMLIGNIIGILVIIGIICAIIFVVLREKKITNQNEEKENIEQVMNIIKDAKDTKQFDYSDPMKQEDETYKIKIINKQSKKSNAYYIVDLKKKEYTLVATGYIGCKDDDCESNQKDS